LQVKLACKLQDLTAGVCTAIGKHIVAVWIGQAFFDQLRGFWTDEFQVGTG
jgi:hypothetical protein